MHATRLRNWVERGLKAGGHPPLDKLVKAGRLKADPTGWAPLAADISARSGESVSYETLRQWYAHLEQPEPSDAA